MSHHLLILMLMEGRVKFFITKTLLEFHRKKVNSCNEWWPFSNLLLKWEPPPVHVRAHTEVRMAWGETNESSLSLQTCVYMLPRSFHYTQQRDMLHVREGTCDHSEYCTTFLPVDSPKPHRLYIHTNFTYHPTSSSHILSLFNSSTFRCLPK